MQTLTFENTNGSVDIGQGDSDYLLIKITGVSGLGATFETQKAPFQDGTTYLSTNFEPRNITIQGLIKATDITDLNTKRRLVQKLFHPQIESTLTYSNDTYTKDCTVVCEKTPVFSQEQKDEFCYQVFFVSMVAHNPFWLDQEYTGELMSIALAAFSFDLEFADEIEFETDGNNRATLTNDGDVETPVLMTFTGPATNPRIDNETTGEYIAVTKVLTAGQSIIISTEFGNKYVNFDDGAGNITSAFEKIDIASKFFQLETGDNIIAFSADAGTSTAQVLVQYKNRFLGF